MNSSAHPSRRGTSSKATDNDTADGSTAESVGSLLAAIANSINDALRLLMFADKAHWGPDEFEQVRALEHTLDEAKKDFQEMGPLLKGSVYYENDRRRMCTPPSLTSLTSLFFPSIYLIPTGDGDGGPMLAGSKTGCGNLPFDLLNYPSPLVMCYIPICTWPSIAHVTLDSAARPYR